MNKKITFGKLLILAVLIVYTVFLFFPIITVLLTSFVPSNELATSTDFIWWPENFTLDAYKTIFVYDSYIDAVGMPGLLLGFINTMWLTLIPLLIGLVVAGFSAYAFSKMDFPFKEQLFKFSVVIRSVPLGAFGVISYVFYSAIGWTGEAGFLPLLIPGMLGSIGTMFFLRLFFDGISNSLIEAATLDGAGFFQCFFKIMFPLAKPAFIAQFIFGFVAGYNSYLSPMLYLQNQPKFVTLQLYLSEIRSLFPTAGSENIYCAAAILGMLPLVIIYCCMQKYFIEGVSAGSVKE
ncbi:MAG: carbohydrate ABC transporter permease [Oscillospiraceae bacterium]|jgi:multiple sugar transport system permease protein|nr:carbohydrate ABC transporter permease [Oscillospiraceae bacterium]